MSWLAGDRGDAAADGAGAGEVDHLRCRRWATSRSPIVLVARSTTLEHAGGETGLGEQLGDQQAAGQRRLAATA